MWSANPGARPGSAGCSSTPKFDELFRERLRIGHDYLDVPRDQLIVAAEAWER
jgi:hypothetical protein